MSYGARVALTGVSLRVGRGEIVALAGPNGSGKTTLLKAAAGLLPYSGSVQLAGEDLARMPRTRRALKLAYVPQRSALDAALPAYAVVAQGRQPYRHLLGGLSPRDRAAVRRALDAVQMSDPELVWRPYTRLSHGEQRLVLLARALASEAPLVLLDEPTAALDVRHVLDLFSVLRRLARDGAGVLVVLHQLHEVAELADRVALLSSGALRYSGPVAEVIAPDPVRQVYRVELVRNAGFAYAAAEGP